MNCDHAPGEFINGASNVHRIPSKAVDAADDDPVTFFQAIHKFREAWALKRGYRPGNNFLDKPTRVDRKSGRLDLQPLIFGREIAPAYPGIGKCAAQAALPVSLPGLDL